MKLLSTALLAFLCLLFLSESSLACGPGSHHGKRSVDQWAIASSVVNCKLPACPQGDGWICLLTAKGAAYDDRLYYPIPNIKN